jgi:hypothetical protein
MIASLALALGLSAGGLGLSAASAHDTSWQPALSDGRFGDWPHAVNFAYAGGHGSPPYSGGSTKYDVNNPANGSNGYCDAVDSHSNTVAYIQWVEFNLSGFDSPSLTELDGGQPCYGFYTVSWVKQLEAFLGVTQDGVTDTGVMNWIDYLADNT